MTKSGHLIFMNLATLVYNIYDALFFRDRWTTPTIEKGGGDGRGVKTDAMRCLARSPSFFIFMCVYTDYQSMLPVCFCIHVYVCVSSLIV